jgi:hypothetical protein
LPKKIHIEGGLSTYAKRTLLALWDTNPGILEVKEQKRSIRPVCLQLTPLPALAQTTAEILGEAEAPRFQTMNCKPGTWVQSTLGLGLGKQGKWGECWHFCFEAIMESLPVY